MKKFILGMFAVGILLAGSALRADEYTLTIGAGSYAEFTEPSTWRFISYTPTDFYVKGELNVVIEADLAGNVTSVQFPENADGSKQVFYVTSDNTWTLGAEVPENLHSMQFDPTAIYDFTSSDDLDKIAKADMQANGNFTFQLIYNDKGDVQVMHMNPDVPLENETTNPMEASVVLNSNGDIIYAEIEIPFYYMDYGSAILEGMIVGRWGSLGPEGEVPEPATIAMMLTGLLGLGFYGYRRRNRKIVEK